MLTSLATRFKVARTFCCISDDWDTSTVASMPFLNSCVVAARTIKPKAMATSNSTRLKPRAVDVGLVVRIALLRLSVSLNVSQLCPCLSLYR